MSRFVLKGLRIPELWSKFEILYSKYSQSFYKEMDAFFLPLLDRFIVSENATNPPSSELQLQLINYNNDFYYVPNWKN